MQTEAWIDPVIIAAIAAVIAALVSGIFWIIRDFYYLKKEYRRDKKSQAYEATLKFIVDYQLLHVEYHQISKNVINWVKNGIDIEFIKTYYYQRMNSIKESNFYSDERQRRRNSEASTLFNLHNENGEIEKIFKDIWKILNEMDNNYMKNPTQEYSDAYVKDFKSFYDKHFKKLYKKLGEYCKLVRKELGMEKFGAWIRTDENT